MKRRGRSDGANEFQSTLPARGATTSSPASCCRRCHFNPRSPHGERLFINSRKSFASGFQSTLPARGATPTHDFQSCALHISIHAPRTGSDSDLLDKFMGLDISIHAPRTGSDVFVLSQLRRLRIFQSTLPARGATCRKTRNALPAAFQSTLPARGATTRDGTMRVSKYISIHAPRTGSDRRWSL